MFIKNLPYQNHQNMSKEDFLKIRKDLELVSKSNFFYNIIWASFITKLFTQLFRKMYVFLVLSLLFLGHLTK